MVGAFPTNNKKTNICDTDKLIVYQEMELSIMWHTKMTTNRAKLTNDDGLVNG